jgi:cell wall-associated NlpC family hydrolase
LSRISARLRALAITTLAAAVLLSTSTTGDTLAAEADSDSIVSTSPGLTAEPSPTPDATPAPTVEPVASPDSIPAVVALPARSVPASAVVVAFARSHLRAPYRHASTGPSSFDCSGLMWRVFREAGLSGKVTSTSARGIYLSYRAHGLASRTNPQVGDLVVWGNGSHVGVYIGRGLAISALVQGVRVHRVRAMFTPFTAYLQGRQAGLGAIAREAHPVAPPRHPDGDPASRCQRPRNERRAAPVGRPLRRSEQASGRWPTVAEGADVRRQDRLAAVERVRSLIARRLPGGKRSSAVAESRPGSGPSLDSHR